MANYQSSYTGAQIDTAVAKINNLVDYVYPVGAIYISVNSTSPATLFGGTWEQINDKFLLAGDSTNYPYGSTGGAATVTLSEANLPSHRHGLKGHTFTWGANSASNVVRSSTGEVATASAATGNMFYTLQNDYNYSAYTGSGTAHNNMPPYLSVYMWKRTA